MDAASWISKPSREASARVKKLGGSAEDHQLGVRQQGLKIDHGTDADEQHQREQLCTLNTNREQGIQNVLYAGPFHSCGQIHQNCAKSHGQQQSRLHFLCNGQINQQSADGPHNDLIQLQVHHILI